MAKRTGKSLDALIFIDTNILLDFYRIRKSDISMQYLSKIENHKALIIVSSQVEMEFKKNRQAVIMESIGEVNKISSVNLRVPALLADARASKMLQKFKSDLEAQQKKLRLKIENILKEPLKYDPVFKSLQRVFKYQSEINLNRENKLRFAIRKLALKRFMLGYPPRKKNDTSIGDAINWEWVIHCSNLTNKHIIIVTRDTDYGTIYDGEYYPDDWLAQEFKQRTSAKRKLIITDKLSKAFKLVAIPVTHEMEKEEDKVIHSVFLSHVSKDTGLVDETFKGFVNVPPHLKAFLEEAAKKFWTDRDQTQSEGSDDRS